MTPLHILWKGGVKYSHIGLNFGWGEFKTCLNKNMIGDKVQKMKHPISLHVHIGNPFQYKQTHAGEVTS